MHPQPRVPQNVVSCDMISENNQAAAAAVELYYFAGLILDQVALVQGISRPTVAKRLAYGRAWLHRELSERGDA